MTDEEFDAKVVEWEKAIEDIVIEGVNSAGVSLPIGMPDCQPLVEGWNEFIRTVRECRRVRIRS